MKKTDNLMVPCENCGANFNNSEPKCPYCNHMHLPGALNKYEEKLYDIKDNLEDVSEDVTEVYSNSAKQQSKKIITILAVIFGIALLTLGAAILLDYYMFEQHAPTEEHLRLQKAWELENFPYLDELYEQGDYEAIIEFQMSQYGTEADYYYNIYNWEHYEFIEKYAKYRDFIELKNNYGTNNNHDAFNLTSTIGLILDQSYGNQQLSEEHLETIAEYKTEARDYLTNELGINEQMLQEFYDEVIKKHGYLNYQAIYDFAKEFIENKNQ